MALHKLASWNAVEHLEVLVKRLHSSALRVKCGPDMQTCLHCCLSMNALRAYHFLITVDRNLFADLAHETDRSGRSLEQIARDMGI